MNLIRVHRTFPKLRVTQLRFYSQPVANIQDEYSETPEYPPILDMSLQARKFRVRAETYEKIKRVKTIEEKQIALNMPRYYGWKCVMFRDDIIPYNALPMVQHYTKSHFIPSDKLPDYCPDLEQSAASIATDIAAELEDILSTEFVGVQRSIEYQLNKTEEAQKENAVAQSVVRQLNRLIMNNLVNKAPHLLNAQVDYEPRHEAFWMVGGIVPPGNLIKQKQKYPWLSSQQVYESVDRPVQFIGTPFLTVRHSLPLKPLIPYDDAVKEEYKVAEFEYRPENVGYWPDFRHGTNIPGFWPGDLDEFGLLSFHDRGHLVGRSFGDEDTQEALHCQAIKSSFGWLLAQANFQGFTTYNDLTYPLATQTIITNGQLFSFYAYQLNTIAMHNDELKSNPKHNICFGTKPMKLFENIENGKVNGLNTEVLKQLIQIYLNAPEKRDYNMKPYLGEDEQVVADIEDDKRRCWLENRYKQLVSNRPRHELLPEVYHWEQIYKIQFSTRFHERKRRPFELGLNPYKRRLDEHLSPYIPKALRPYPKHKKKFEDTYYPDV